MTRLTSFCAGALEVVNAIAVRLEDVVGEWVDGRAPRPPTREREQVAEALVALERYVDSRVAGLHPQPYRDELHAAVARVAGGRS